MNLTNDTTICSNSMVELQAAVTGNVGLLAYSWDNSLPDTSGPYPVSPSVTTTYTLAVTDSIGCTLSQSVTIAIAAGMNINTPDTSTCLGVSITINASVTGVSPFIYSWNPTTGLDDSTIINPTANPYTSTTYTLTVEDNIGCTDTSSMLIMVNSIPDATIASSGATTFCDGDSVILNGNTGAGLSYQWYKDVVIISGATDSIYIINQSGSYTVEVIQNGCDSTSTAIPITVHPVFFINLAATICQGDSILLEGSYQYTGGAYYDSLSTTNGCDSIIITDLTVIPNYINNISAEICEGDSILLGGSYQYTEGLYYDSLSTSVYGCDSIIITNLSVNPGNTINAFAEICENDSIELGGAYQNSPGTYYDTLSSINNCDSIIITTLTVNPKPETPIITESNNILTSSSNTGNQWYLNGNIITDSTSQNFTPTENGSYNVEVTDTNNCFSASSLFDVTFVGIIENNLGDQLSVYPNPTSGHLSITLGSYYEDINAIVKNMAGQIISTYHIGAADKFDLEIIGVTGYYLVHIETSSGKSATIKVLKE